VRSEARTLSQLKSLLKVAELSVCTNGCILYPPLISKKRGSRSKKISIALNLKCEMRKGKRIDFNWIYNKIHVCERIENNSSITPSAVFRASAILSLRFCNFEANVSFHLSKTAFRFIAMLDKSVNFTSAFLILLRASDTEKSIFLFL